MPVTIDSCIVFDDDEWRARHREEQVDSMLGRLAAQDIVEFTGDAVLRCTKRGEVLEAVTDATSPLLISDMSGDSSANLGNIGARLVRAVAQHEVGRPKTWRILWSQHHVISVTDRLRRYVHAFAAYRPDSATDLAEATKHAIGIDEPWTTAEEFPAARPVDAWQHDLAARVTELVGEPILGDDRVALRLAQRVARPEIERELRRIQEPHRANVADFISAVRTMHGLPSPEDAHALVRQLIGPVSRDLPVDSIHPDHCDAALACRTNLRATRNDREYLAVTWLTPAEDELLATFLRLYGPQVSRLRAGADRAKIDVIHNIIGTPLDPPDPEYQAATESLGVDNTDLAYAIWTLVDTHALR